MVQKATIMMQLSIVGWNTQSSGNINESDSIVESSTCDIRLLSVAISALNVSSTILLVPNGLPRRSSRRKLAIRSDVSLPLIVATAALLALLAQNGRDAFLSASVTTVDVRSFGILKVYKLGKWEVSQKHLAYRDIRIQNRLFTTGTTNIEEKEVQTESSTIICLSSVNTRQ